MTKKPRHLRSKHLHTRLPDIRVTGAQRAGRTLRRLGSSRLQFRYTHLEKITRVDLRARRVYVLPYV